MVNPHKGYWGQQLRIDMRGCDIKSISSFAKIQKWLLEIVPAIDMKVYGDPIIAHFADHSPKTKGFTAIQLIETSSITAHFAEEIGEAYIDIFSCKSFDQHKALSICNNYFKPDFWKTTNEYRGQGNKE